MGSTFSFVLFAFGIYLCVRGWKKSDTKIFIGIIFILIGLNNLLPHHQDKELQPTKKNRFKTGKMKLPEGYSLPTIKQTMFILPSDLTEKGDMRSQTVTDYFLHPRGVSYSTPDLIVFCEDIPGAEQTIQYLAYVAKIPTVNTTRQDFFNVLNNIYLDPNNDNKTILVVIENSMLDVVVDYAKKWCPGFDLTISQANTNGIQSPGTSGQEYMLSIDNNSGVTTVSVIPFIYMDRSIDFNRDKIQAFYVDGSCNPVKQSDCMFGESIVDFISGKIGE